MEIIWVCRAAMLALKGWNAGFEGENVRLWGWGTGIKDMECWTLFGRNVGIGDAECWDGGNERWL